MKKNYFFLLLTAATINVFAWDKQVTLQVKKASDDIEESLKTTDNGGTDYNSSDLELGSEEQDGSKPQLVGIRFSDIPVSKNVKINAAFLEFELDATSKTADPFKMFIWAEDVDSTATFNGATSVPYSVSSRAKLTDSIEWTIPAGAFNTTNSKYQSADISTLLQQLINRTNWKSGNAVTFFLKGTGTREVESYEGEAGAAAKLIIKYALTGADSIAELAKMRKKEVAIQIKQASDDIEEHLPPSIYAPDTDYNSSDLELGSEDKDGSKPQMVAVRFPGIPVGKNRIITDAHIEFELDATSKTADPFNVHIWAEDADSAATFNGSANVPYSVTSRVKLTDSITWNIPAGGFNTKDQKYPTSNINALVQQLVNRSNWKSGNAAAFYIKGSGTREVESFEGEPAAAAKLYITYAMLDEDIAQHIADSIANSVEGRLTASLDSMANVLTSRLSEANYTVPSWTLYKRAEVAYKNARILNDTTALHNAQTSILVPKEKPYTVSMAINGNPKNQLGFTWYTNLGIHTGMVQIVAGNSTDFTSPMTFAADTIGLRNVNYNNSTSNLPTLAGIANGQKKNYSSHKALATGLTANTTYSYRVGYEGAWSEVGTFTTAADENTDFSFMYIADTQAHNDEYFAVSQRTINAAKNLIDNPKFCMMTGDLVETSGNDNSEWEWEQWFETNKAVWKNLPIAPICGNHDKSANKNLTNHFNTAKIGFDQTMSTTPGSVYSFVQGNALFIACSTEDYSVPGYLDSLKNFIRREVAAHPTVKWKFAFYHKTIYTGSGSHQSDSDGKTVRKALVPIFDEVGIDMAFQGHDHIYEVIGATKNFTISSNSNKEVLNVNGGVRENMTGKEGGMFNVKNGTLFFLNNSAGKKKYEPRTQAQMDAALTSTEITNYWGMFTGKFGQTGEPTFSDVKVTADTVFVTTYTVNDLGVTSKFDSFKVVKTDNFTNTIQVNDKSIQVMPNPAKNEIRLVGADSFDKIELYNIAGELIQSKTGINTLDIRGYKNGIYLVKAKLGNKLFVDQVIVNN